MPSLRRTFSAPSRSSPYCNTPQTRTSSRSPRRSSGSDTSNRRVLADIDWWRVEAAQREVRGLAPHEQLRPASPASSDEDEQEREQEERSPSPSPSPVATPAYNAGSSSDVPLWHSIPGAGWDVFDSFASEHPFGHIESLTRFAAPEHDPTTRRPIPKPPRSRLSAPHSKQQLRVLRRLLPVFPVLLILPLFLLFLNTNTPQHGLRRPVRRLGLGRRERRAVRRALARWPPPTDLSSHSSPGYERARGKLLGCGERARVHARLLLVFGRGRRGFAPPRERVRAGYRGRGGSVLLGGARDYVRLFGAGQWKMT
ncbi:hypothetical protein BDW22DRAFT_1026921 [Trametopsis cervina]|nr:hypothetical protein BDW22DRAFT_1026921 [Trametopsis cervina]